MLSSNKDFKEQMAEARRRQILMGAAQVFAEKGFHKATTKEIAKAAGIAEGTIYNYFHNKRELLVALIELIGTQSLKDVFQAHAADDPKALFRAILHDRHQLMHERGPFLAPIVAEIFADAELRQAVYHQIMKPLAAHLEQYLQGYIDSGKFRPVDPVIVTRAFMGAMMINFALKLTRLESRYENVSVEAMIEQLVSLFLDGLLVGKEGRTKRE